MTNDKPKFYFWVILDLLLAALFVNVVLFVMPAIKKFSDSFYPTRTLSVSAEGRATISPDLAEASFSVLSRGINPDQLADANNQKMTAVLDFVKSQGIDPKDIKTTGYSLAPDYRYDPKTERNFITGYTLTQTVQVKIRDLAKVAKIIGGLTPLGVNQIGGINFTVDDPEKVLSDARADAFARAQAKAKAMAEANGLRLGKIVSVGEYGAPIPYYSLSADKFGRGGAPMAAEVALPTIEPGTQDIRVNVSLTYTLE